jgi:hypothetical protein
MTTRVAALRCVLLLAALIAAFAMLTLAVLHDLATELADEIRASRNESRSTRGGTVPYRQLPRNIKLWDSTTKLKVANARLAALVGHNTTVAAGEASDGRQLADEMALVGRSA